MNKPTVDHDAANPVDKTWKSHWSGQDVKPETRKRLRREKREAKRRLHKQVRRGTRQALADLDS